MYNSILDCLGNIIAMIFGCGLFLFELQVHFMIALGRDIVT